jgi:hypothetical protein
MLEYLTDPSLRCYALEIDDLPVASAVLVATGGDGSSMSTRSNATDGAAMAVG